MAERWRNDSEANENLETKHVYMDHGDCLDALALMSLMVSSTVSLVSSLVSLRVPASPTIHRSRADAVAPSPGDA